MRTQHIYEEFYSHRRVKLCFIYTNPNSEEQVFSLWESDAMDSDKFITASKDICFKPEELLQFLTEIDEFNLGITDEWKTEVARANLLNLIAKHSESEDVKSFYIDGTSVWLTDDERQTLHRSSLLLSSTNDKIPLWVGDSRFALPHSFLIDALAQLEQYSLECKDATRYHQLWAKNAYGFEQIIYYDYTADYPAKVSFDTNTIQFN